MRFIVSIIGFALFIVGCNSMVPVTERVIELPTREYQRVPRHVERMDEYEPGVKHSEVLSRIRESCHKFGRFIIVHNNRQERYSCHPEEK
jgi:hypothetical protein